MEVMRIEDDIEQVALHAMGSAAAMFASLNQLALFFLKYFEHGAGRLGATDASRRKRENICSSSPPWR